MRRVLTVPLLSLVLSTYLPGTLPAQDLDQVPEPDGPRVRAGFEELYARQAVANDDWESEAISAAIQSRLYDWGKAFAVEPADISRLASDCQDCVLTPLRPAAPVVFETDLLRLRRGEAAQLAIAPRVRGPRAFGAQLDELLAALPAESRRFAFKIDRVETRADGARVQALYSGYGEGPAGAVEHHATWSMQWSLDPAPRLLSLEVSRHEEIERFGGPLLEDCTDSLLGANPSWAAQLEPPLHRWWRYLDRMSGVTFRGYQGLSVGDLDGDGLDDLFVAQPGGLPDRLYLQQSDGTAHDVSAEAAVDYLELTRSALILDLDNDGDQDLATVRAAHIVILRNLGRARFEPAAVLPLEGAVMASAADYDGDGDLDLYGVGYRNPDEGLPPTPYYDALNGQRNHLYRNEGDLRFVDVTAEVGLGRQQPTLQLRGRLGGLRQRRRPRPLRRQRLRPQQPLSQRRRRFRDVAAEAGCRGHLGRHGRAAGPTSTRRPDGSLRLQHVLLRREDGSPTSGASAATTPRRPAVSTSATRGATRCFDNLGDGTFEDVSEEARRHHGAVGLGGGIRRHRQRRLPDIVVPNGFLTNESSERLVKFLLAAGRVAVTHEAGRRGGRRRPARLPERLAGDRRDEPSGQLVERPGA